MNDLLPPWDDLDFDGEPRGAEVAVEAPQEAGFPPYGRRATDVPVAEPEGLGEPEVPADLGDAAPPAGFELREPEPESEPIAVEPAILPEDPFAAPPFERRATERRTAFGADGGTSGSFDRRMPFGSAEIAGAGASDGMDGALGTNATGSGGRVLDFRRPGAQPRRRRRSLLVSLARPLGVALLTVALPLGLGTWVLSSRRFQLRTVTVRHREAAAPAPVAAASARRVETAWVQSTLAPFLGRNVLRLPLAEVRQRLAANPWVAVAEVAKRLPDEIQVTIGERRPVVLLRTASALLFADAAGRSIAPVGSAVEEVAARRQGLLVVHFLARPAAAAADPAVPASAGPATPPSPPTLAMEARESPESFSEESGIAGALQVAAQLRALHPAWANAIAEIDVMDEDDYKVRIDGLPCPLLVRGSCLAANLVRFEQLLPELTRRYPALAGVDLRFSRRIVVQPAAAPPPDGRAASVKAEHRASRSAPLGAGA